MPDQNKGHSIKPLGILNLPQQSVNPDSFLIFPGNNVYKKHQKKTENYKIIPCKNDFELIFHRSLVAAKDIAY